MKMRLFGVVTSSPSAFMLFTFFMCLSLRHASLSSIKNLHLRPTHLWQVLMYDLRKELGAKPCIAQGVAISRSSPGRPSLTAFAAPSSKPFTSHQLVLSPPHLFSPPLGSLGNDSSRSGIQNQCKVTLKGFSLLNC